jgi:hypothetical protein
VFDLLEASLYLQPLCGKTEIEMGHREFNAAKCVLQEGDVKGRAVKGDEAFIIPQFPVEVFRRKVPAVQKTFIVVPVIKADHGDVAAAVRLQTARLDIEADRISFEHIKKTPLLSAFDCPAEIVGVARAELLLKKEKALIEEPFPFQAEGKQRICTQEVIPRQDALLPEPALFFFSDAVKDAETVLYHSVVLCRGRNAPLSAMRFAERLMQGLHGRNAARSQNLSSRSRWGIIPDGMLKAP